MMQELWRHLQFLPHGRRLLTSSAAFWFFSARVLVFAMAMAEAVAWAYLGFLFGEGLTRFIVATFTGVVIFLVVWIIDVSLITLDRAWSEHKTEILGQLSSRDRWRKVRECFTFSLRIALLLGSLTITAPYLAQLVFHKDIERFIAAEATAALDRTRKELIQKFDSLIAAKDVEIESKRSEYVREIAGQGPSRRYGSGPAAEAILRTVSKLEAAREAMRKEKDSTINAFDTLAKNWPANRDRLGSAYNVVLPQPSILENRKALEALRTRPENQSTEFAIKAFLAFIFAGLLLLKLFEPNSVRLYLSDVLQQEYMRYLAGTFDSMLPPSERSTSNQAAMSPQRLHEFLVRIWVPARNLEEQTAKTRARTTVATQSLDMLERMRSQIANDVVAATSEVNRLRVQADDASQSLTELQSAIRAVQTDIESFETELQSLDEEEVVNLDDRNVLVYEKIRGGYRSSINRKVADAERALRELRETLPTETQKLQRVEVTLKVAEAKLREKEFELAETDKKIQNIRQLLAGSIGEGVRSILSPAT